MVRPDWNTYFMEIAKVVASRATCPRGQVGAAIVKDNRILATGYNGSLPGESHCTEVGCLMIDGHCERTVHAETNAVIQASKFGVSVSGATIYVWRSLHSETGKPVPVCFKCDQVIKSSGIVKVIMN